LTGFSIDDIHVYVKKPKKPPKDPNKLAYQIVRMSVEDPEELKPEQTIEQPKERSPIWQYLAEIGRKGGLKGGKARAAKLSAEQRKEIARKAADKRWSKYKP